MIKKPEPSDPASIIDINDNMDIIDGLINKNNFNGAVDPGTGDDIVDGYAVGSNWWNVTDHRLFVAESVATGAAVWRQIYPADSGWIEVFETWTYASADAPTFTFTVPGDKSTKYYPGMRIKLTQTTVKYFIITGVVYSSPNTMITVYGGTDYTLASEAIIYPYYSSAKAPAGFPLDPTKWTVTFTDSTKREQATPTAGTWYNLGSLSVAVPIGAWRVRSKIPAQINRSGGVWVDLFVTISTGNNNESTPELTDKVFVNPNDGFAFVAKAQGLIVLASKTTHYFNVKTVADTSSIEFSNDQIAMVVTFECAYL